MNLKYLFFVGTAYGGLIASFFPCAAQASTVPVTYQGSLSVLGLPANGTFDLQYTAVNAATNGTVVDGPFTNLAVAVSNGGFTTVLNLDASAFSAGNNVWLSLGVRTNGSSGSFTALAPTQPITYTPYSIFSQNSTFATLSSRVGNDSITAASFQTAQDPTAGQVLEYVGNGLFSANNLVWTNISAGESVGWSLTGNAGTSPGLNFIGTTDAQNFQMRVNGQLALTLVPTSTATIIGGSPLNNAFGVGDTVSGGYSNVIGSSYEAFIGGGSFNTITSGSDFGSIAGGYRNKIDDEAAGASYIGGGYSNSIGIFSYQGTIGGGFDNTISGGFNTIAGGFFNSISNSASYSAIGGGLGNAILNGISGTPRSAIIAGGASNIIAASQSTIGGGMGNFVGGAYSVIAGGDQNSITTNASASEPLNATISGGSYNVVSGSDSTVPGGANNTASGFASFATGLYAQATNDFCFVWSSGAGALPLATTGNYQFLIGNSMRVGINTNSPGATLDVNGQIHSSADISTGGSIFGFGVNATTVNATGNLQAGGMQCTSNIFAGGSINGASVTATGQITAACFNGPSCTPSDRNLKEHFVQVDCREILNRIVALPISRWDYKTDASTPHLGPMAQDFYDAFHLGQDDKHIFTVDEGGVALAAIQGLNEKMEFRAKELEAQNTALKKQNDLLIARLNGLEAMVRTLATKN